MSPVTSIADALCEVEALLTPLGAEARSEAQWLMAACLRTGRAGLVTAASQPIDPGTLQQARAWARRRAAGEPLAYLAGHREFWSLDLEVGPEVLVPRPETEGLVERALQHGDARAAAAAHPPAVVDLGTGSGAIALSIARERPHWPVLATDASSGALAVARRNALKHGLSRVEFRLGDWFAPVTGRRFDLVLSNPPYVAAEDPAMHSDSLRFEPRMALTPGTDALAALRAIVAAAPGHLLPEGWLLLEHGATQGGAVRDLLVARGFRHVGSLPDLAGHERVTEGQWPAQPAPGSNLAHRNHHAPL